jgi:hypothetical protein
MPGHCDACNRENVEIELHIQNVCDICAECMNLKEDR